MALWGNTQEEVKAPHKSNSERKKREEQTEPLLCWEALASQSKTTQRQGRYWGLKLGRGKAGLGHTSPSTSGQSPRRVSTAPSHTVTRTDHSQDRDTRQQNHPLETLQVPCPAPQGSMVWGLPRGWAWMSRNSVVIEQAGAHSGLRCPQEALGSSQRRRPFQPLPPPSSLGLPGAAPFGIQLTCHGKRGLCVLASGTHLQEWTLSTKPHPLPPHQCHPRNKGRSQGRVLPHPLALFSLQTPTKKTSPPGQLSPAATALCKKLQPHMEWKLPSTPDISTWGHVPSSSQGPCTDRRKNASTETETQT